MKKISRIGLLGLVVLLGVATPINVEANKYSFFKKKYKKMLKKHKRKIAAGIAAGALAVGAAYGIYSLSDSGIVSSILKKWELPTDENFMRWGNIALKQGAQGLNDNYERYQSEQDFYQRLQKKQKRKLNFALVELVNKRHDEIIMRNIGFLRR